MHRDGVDSKTGPANLAVFETEKARDHRMLLFDERGILIPKKDRHEIPIVFWRVVPPRQILDHVFFAVKRLPGILVGLGPLFRAH